MSTNMKQIAGLFNDCIDTIRSEKHDNLEQMAVDWLTDARYQLMRSIEDEYEILILSTPNCGAHPFCFFAGTTSSLLLEKIQLNSEAGLLIRTKHYPSIPFATHQSYAHMQQPCKTISRSLWMLAGFTRQSPPSGVCLGVTHTRWRSISLIA